MSNLISDQVKEANGIMDEIAKKKIQLGSIAEYLQSCLWQDRKTDDPIIDFLLLAGPNGEMYDKKTHDYIRRVIDELADHQGELVVVVKEIFVTTKTTNTINDMKKEGYKSRIFYLGKITGALMAFDDRTGDCYLPNGNKFCKIGKGLKRRLGTSRSRFEENISISFFSFKKPVKKLPVVICGDKAVREFFRTNKMERLLDEKIEEL